MSSEVESLKRAAAVTQEVTWKYIVPVILVLGLVGNTFTVIVLKRGSLGKSSAVVYLFMLALLDTGALVSGFVTSYLQAAWNIVLLNDSAAACQLLRAIFPFFSNAGFWVLVAFTVDRYIAVCFPLRKTLLCRPRRAIAVCATLMVVSAAKSLRTFWTYGLRRSYNWNIWKYEYKCYTMERYEHFERRIRPYLSMAFVFIIPFLIIICCNVMIIRRLRQGNRLLQRTNADRKLTQTTAMCLSISFAFFLFASPTFAALVAIHYMHTDQADKSEMQFRFLEIISAMLLYLHHAVNFYLYCLTGQQFRSDLKAALFGRCVRAGTGHGKTGQKVLAKPQQRATNKTGNGANISIVDDTAASTSTGPQTTTESISEDRSTAFG